MKNETPATTAERCEDCGGIVSPETWVCEDCGLGHDDPCAECGRRAVHTDDCSIGDAL